MFGGLAMLENRNHHPHQQYCKTEKEYIQKHERNVEWQCAQQSKQGKKNRCDYDRKISLLHTSITKAYRNCSTRTVEKVIHCFVYSFRILYIAKATCLS